MIWGPFRKTFSSRGEGDGITGSGQPMIVKLCKQRSGGLDSYN